MKGQLATSVVVSLRAILQARKSFPIYLTAGHFTIFRKLCQDAIGLPKEAAKSNGRFGQRRDCQ
jgi:hypothetical protein